MGHMIQLLKTSLSMKIVVYPEQNFQRVCLFIYLQTKESLII